MDPIASRVTSAAIDIDVVEPSRDSEFERIKQNFRSTVISHDIPANYPETQAAFQELQNELEEFLALHIPKVAALQSMVTSALSGNDMPGFNRMTGRSSTMARARSPVPMSDVETPPDIGADPSAFSASDRANIGHHDGVLPSRHSSMQRRKTAVDAHMEALQTFLTSHLENMRLLQQGAHGPPLAVDASSHGHGPVMTRPPGPATSMSHANHVVPPSKLSHTLVVADGRRRQDELVQHLRSVTAISSISIIFILMFLVLSTLILGGRDETAFNVAMMFAFFAVSFHFGIILIGGRGARTITHDAILPEKEKSERDPVYFNFYLAICEQLQLLATASLVIALLILVFLIFNSLAYPFVLVFLSAFGAVIIFMSGFFKVLITVENMVFLAKNMGRLGWRTLDYIKTNVK